LCIALVGTGKASDTTDGRTLKTDEKIIANGDFDAKQATQQLLVVGRGRVNLLAALR